MKASTYALLVRRRFAPLFATSFGGALNDNVLRNALIAMITFGVIASDPGERATLVQAALGLFMLPFFLFSASAGRFADRCPDRAVAVRWIKGVEIFTMAVAAVGLALNSAAMLLLAVFLAGVQSAYFGPFKYALLPELLVREELIGGNALMNASTYVAILAGVFVGTQLGASLDNQLTTTAILIVIALLGFAAALAMPSLAGTAATWRESWSFNIFADIVRTIKASMRQPGIMPVILLISWFWTSGAIISAQLPLIVRDIYGYDQNCYLLLLLVVCLGIALGSLANAAVQRGRTTTRWVPWGMALAALCCLGLEFPARPPVADAASLLDLQAFVTDPGNFSLVATFGLLSAAMGFYIVPMYTTLQLIAAKGSRGQMVATNNILNALFIVCGVLVAGAIVGRGGSLAAAMGELLALIGALGLVIALAAWLGLRRIKTGGPDG